MAPSVSEIQKPAEPTATETVKAQVAQGEYLYKPDPSYEYSKYLPFKHTVESKDPPLEYFDHVDPATRADPAKPNLLTPSVSLKHLSPYLGTEVKGVQLSQLTKEARDELALFVAERKVVIFRDQDLKDQTPESQLEHFGVPHVHPLASNVKGFPPLLSAYRDASRPPPNSYLHKERINHTGWHSDISFEKQPAGTTFFYVLDGPDVGGDTLFLSTTEAYNRLSPEFKKLLVGLKAVHTSELFEKYTVVNGTELRRDTVYTEHPVVGVHPVTGEKALYVSGNFTKNIVGLKKEESDALLQFLYDHIAKGADFQVRATYEPGTVVVWDNRVTQHSIVPDFDNSIRRHHVRLTPQAEKPIPATEA